MFQSGSVIWKTMISFPSNLCEYIIYLDILAVASILSVITLTISIAYPLQNHQAEVAGEEMDQTATLPQISL